MTKQGSRNDSSPRHSPSSEDGHAWMDKENAACNFRDERLKKRFRLLLQQFWNGMGQTIPFACQDWASTITPTRVPIEEKESYRWLENLRQSTQLFDDPARANDSPPGNMRGTSRLADMQLGFNLVSER